MGSHIETLRAPAKLNLGLRIMGIRQSNDSFSGYHEIESLFVPVSIFDELEISTHYQDEIVFEQGKKTLGLQGDTLTKSLIQFRKLAKVPPLRVRIQKNIPMGAGMGGGSSDAGIFLQFLHKHFAPKLPSQSLLECALQVGADVPFFLQSKPALVSGIGEMVEPRETEKMSFLVIQPDFQISTKDAYAWLDEERQLTRRNTDATSGMINEVSGSKLRRNEVFKTHEIIENLINDFENSVEKRHPEIGMMKKALRTRGALGNLMSGTGSSVYGIFRNLSEAVSARESLQANFPSDYVFFVCETLV